MAQKISKTKFPNIFFIYYKQPAGKTQYAVERFDINTKKLEYDPEIYDENEKRVAKSIRIKTNGRKWQIHSRPMYIELVKVK